MFNNIGYIENYENAAIVFRQNGGESARFDASGNFSIGHGSPSSFSSGANNLVVNDTAGAGGITIDTPNDAKGSIFFADGTSATGQGRIRYNHDGDYMTFGTSGSEDKMVIDSSGKVGISETLPLGKLHVKTGDSGAGINVNADELVVEGSGTAGITILSGTSGDGNIFFDDSGGFARGKLSYSHNGDYLSLASTGSSIFYNGGLERMRISSTGKITTRGTTATGYAVLEFGTININNNVADGTVDFTQGLVFTDNSSNEGAWTHAGICSTGSSGYNGNLVFGTDGNSSRTSNVITERMRIDSSGRVGIAQDAPADFNAAADDLVIGNSSGDFGMTIRTGTASNGSIHFADGTTGDGPNRGIITYDHSDDHMQFNVAAAEKMRISSGGDLLIGMTANDVAQENGAFIQSANGRYFCSLGSNSLNTYHVFSTVNNSYNFYVNCAGTIYSTNTSISSLSDERFKENIVDIDTGLTEVMSLKPRKFDWKDGNGKDIKNDTGFIAQEVETVLPDLIDGFMHNDLDDAKSIKMGDMIPTLVKAIQEQQTIIDDLKTRIETLEG